jgi:tripartite-type tricarboxylate transporter receptor subunit TctC
MMRANRRTVLGLATATAFTAALVNPSGAIAQTTYPERPIRIVVPFPVGTSPDVSGRLIAKKLAEQMGQQVLVDNRPGYTGHIGTESVVRSAPDGYTLVLGASSTHVVSPQVLKTGINYHTVNDVTPIGLVARIPNLLVVHPSVPARTVPELIAHGKANPGKLTFASLGNGSNLHLAGEWFKVKTGVDMAHVPYNAANLATDFLAGRVQLMFDNAITAVPHVKAGRLRALAVASEDPVPDLPGLPALSQFIPGFSLSAWVVLFGPKGLPTDVVQRLERELRTALASDEVKASFAQQVLIPGNLDARQTAQFVRSEYDKWVGILRETGVRVE